MSARRRQKRAPIQGDGTAEGALSSRKTLPRPERNVQRKPGLAPVEPLATAPHDEIHEWPEMVETERQPPNPSFAFPVGARVRHETHGAGTVVEHMGDGRTRIKFANGEEHRYKSSSMHKIVSRTQAKDDALEGFHEGEGHGDKDRPGRFSMRESTSRHLKENEAAKAAADRRRSQETAWVALGFARKLKRKKKAAAAESVHV